MNDTIIAEELAAVLKANSPLVATLTNGAGTPGTISSGQSGDITARPLILVHAGEFTPYGPRRKGELEIEIRSRIGDEGNGCPSHADRVQALWNFLMGAPGADYPTTLANMTAAASVVKAAVTGRGAIELIAYTPAPNALQSDSQDNELRTLLKILPIFRFLS